MVTMGFFGSNDITGIDVGSGSINPVVRIERGRKRPTVLSADIVDFPLESMKDGVGTILRHLLANKKDRQY